MKVAPLDRALHGMVALPGDKSLSHRGLMLAALCSGPSEIRHLGSGGDNKATAACLRQLGVSIDLDGETANVNPQATFETPKAPLDCKNSGTSMRLFMGLLSGLGIEATLIGDESLSGRPMKRVAEPLAALGGHCDTTDGHAPVHVKRRKLVGANVSTGKPSAQVKTALILAGLFAEGQTIVREPELSRDHSERLLQALGFPLEVLPSGEIAVRPLGDRRPPGFSLWIPGDPSSAAFWAVLAALVPGSDVTLIDVSLNPTRIGFVDVLRRMGVRIEAVERGVSAGEPWGDLRICAAASLQATEVSGHEARLAIDELPILMVAMARAQGRSVVRDAADLRNKESDRIDAMAALLRGFGVAVETTPDGIIIDGGGRGEAQVRVAQVDAASDHRIALSAAVMALAGPQAVEVSGFEAAAVSYGAFLSEVKKLTNVAHARGKPVTVAIDGPAGAGKSTVSKKLAERLGYTLVDTGAIYRTVAVLALERGVDIHDGAAVEPIAKSVDIRFEVRPGGQHVLVGTAEGGVRDVSEVIRTPEASRAASIVSQHRQVRDALLGIQRKLAGVGGAVLEGRDIGTVVFPEAQAKFFLDAAAHERARRRLDELRLKGQDADFEVVLREIKERDARDSERDVAPLKPAADAVMLDSTKLEVADVVSEMERRVRAKEKDQ